MEIQESPRHRGSLPRSAGTPERYRVETLLHQAAGRELSLAHDRLLDEPCVLKLARSSSGAARLLSEEGQLLASLSHPGLVGWREQLSALALPGRAEPLSGFSMEAVDGLPFSQDKGPLPERLGRFLRLLSVVHYIHRCGLLHLDIKPDNILVSGGRVVLLDLGSARPLDSGPGEAGGTLGYAAPEILNGHAPSIASDLYSLGAVFYELLTGHRPFSLAESSQLWQAVLLGELVPVRALRPSVPRPLARLAESLLDVDAHRRPDSLVAVAEEIVSLGGDAAAWAPRSGQPLLQGREEASAALRAAARSRGTSLIIGEAGSGRRTLARSMLSELAEEGTAAIDLSRAASRRAALASLETLAPGALVYLGCREEIEAEELSVLDGMAAALSEARVIWSARARPSQLPEASAVRIGGLAEEPLRQICGFFGVYGSERVREVCRGTGGLPGRLVLRLGAERFSPVADATGLHRILSALPLGVPVRLLERFPTALRDELPMLLQVGVVRSEDEKLFVDSPADQALSPEEAGWLVALLRTGGGEDPLWTALSAARLGALEIACGLLDAAISGAEDRSSEAKELCEQLVAAGHRPACLPLARLYLMTGERKRAEATLAQIADPTIEEARAHIGVLRRMRRYPEAIALCEAQLSRRSHPLFIGELIECNRLLGRLDEAEALVGAHEADLSELGPHEALRYRAQIAEGRLARGESVDGVEEMLQRIWERRLSPGVSRTLLSAAANIYHRSLPDPERASELLTLVIRDADQAGDRSNAAGHRINLAGLLFTKLGKGDQAREVAAEGYRIAQELNARNLKMQLCYTLCDIELRSGRLPDAQRWAARFFAEADGSTAPPVRSRCDYIHARLAVAQGDLEGAVATLDRIPIERQDVAFQSSLRLVRAEVLLGLGRHREVLEVLEPRRASEGYLEQATHKALRGQAYLGLARQDLREARAEVRDDLNMCYRLAAGDILLASAGEGMDLATLPQRSADLERAARLLRGEQATRAAALREWVDGGRSVDLEGIVELTEAIQQPQGFPVALARLVTRSLGAHRVLIMLKIPGMGQQVSYNELTGAEAAGICDEVLRRIKTPSDYWLAEDAFSDPHLRETSHTVRTFELKSLVAVPIAYQEKAIGALYVDDLYRAGRFGLDDVKILRRLARAVGGLVPLISFGSQRMLTEPKNICGLLTTDARRVDAMKNSLSMLEGECETNLLITGETGTGKSVLARRLAREVLGCTGLEVVVLRKGDPNMLVTQLVGSRRGEFTGAMNQEGAIQRALRGDRALFLDEVQNLGEVGQQILLPLLESPNRHFGGLTRASRPLEKPLHIILATNIEINQGRWAEHFREDLWYRMSAAHLHLPPLRERGVEAVYRYLSDILEEIGGVPAPEHLFRPAALLQVTGWGWPGNLRQLRTFAYQAAHRYKITQQAIPRHDLPQIGLTDSAPPAPDGLQVLAVKDREQIQVERMLDALRNHRWIQKEAAAALGMGTANFSKLLGRYGLREQVKQRRRAAREQNREV